LLHLMRHLGLVISRVSNIRIDAYFQNNFQVLHIFPFSGRDLVLPEVVFGVLVGEIEEVVDGLAWF
jgi:hypothetical protein